MGLAEIADAKTMFETTNLKERMGRYHRDPEAAFRGWNDAWLDPGFKAWNIEDCLDTLSVPTLALQGVDDQYGTEAQVRIVEKRSPRPVDVVLIDDCKHSPQFDQPDATLQAVGGYIARLQDAPLKVSVE
jgi:pimeloyl-ACP methyl ester carboxylesterase